MISPWNLANRVVRSSPIGDVLAFDFQSSLEYFLKNKNHIPVPARTIPRMSERVWLFIIIDMTINVLHRCYLMYLHTTTKLIRATGTVLSVVGKRLRLLNRICYCLMRARFSEKFDYCYCCYSPSMEKRVLHSLVSEELALLRSNRLLVLSECRQGYRLSTFAHR